jgi:hypothetical protein
MGKGRNGKHKTRKQATRGPLCLDDLDKLHARIAVRHRPDADLRDEPVLHRGAKINLWLLCKQVIFFLQK